MLVDSGNNTPLSAGQFSILNRRVEGEGRKSRVKLLRVSPQLAAARDAFSLYLGLCEGC